jgi:hypothetical protein
VARNPVAKRCPAFRDRWLGVARQPTRTLIAETPRVAVEALLVNVGAVGEEVKRIADPRSPYSPRNSQRGLISAVLGVLKWRPARPSTATDHYDFGGVSDTEVSRGHDASLPMRARRCARDATSECTPFGHGNESYRKVPSPALKTHSSDLPRIGSRARQGGERVRLATGACGNDRPVKAPYATRIRYWESSVTDTSRGIPRLAGGRVQLSCRMTHST